VTITRTEARPRENLQQRKTGGKITEYFIDKLGAGGKFRNMGGNTHQKRRQKKVDKEMVEKRETHRRKEQKSHKERQTNATE